MASRTIKADSKLRLQAPIYEVSTSNYYLVNPPPVSNTNVQILSRNASTGEVQLVQNNSAKFSNEIIDASVSGFSLINNPGTSNSHLIKTLQSSDGSIGITSSSESLNLRSLVTLSNANPLGDTNVLQTTGIGSNFSFKSINAGSKINLISDSNTITISTPGNIELQNRGTGVQIIHDPGIDDNFSLKSLIAGNNVSLNSNDDEIIIGTSLTGNITQSNLGIGEPILSDPGSDDTFSYKNLVAGSHITLGSDAGTITIGTNLTGNITLHAVGSGDNFLSDAGTDNDFSFKSILAGSDINILPIGNDIVVSAPQQNITLSNLGIGANVLATPGTLSSFDFKTLVQGTGISISNGSNSITISSSITQSNIGIGSNTILKNPGTGTNFDFKSIIAGSGIQITNGINDLTFATNITTSNVGSGSGILATTSTGSSLDFKSIIAGTGITISSTSNSITINATQGITMNNVGIGNGRIMKTTGTASSFDVKSLFAGTNISLINDTDEITINIPNSNAANLGLGEGILVTTGSASISTVRNFKTLIAGSGITLTATANDITIESSGSSGSSNMANLGTGEPVLVTTGSLPISTVRNFKTIKAGTNVSISSSSDEITINADYSPLGSTGFSTEITSGTLTSIAVNPSYTTISSYTTPTYGYNSGILNTGTGVVTITDVGYYIVSCYIQASNTTATASSKNYIDIIFRNNTTSTTYVNVTQDMPSNGIYTLGFTKPCNLTAGTYELRLSKQRTGGTFTIYTGADSGFSIYRIY